MWPYLPELLDRAVPRYTSYPTAAEFGEDVGPTEMAEALASVTASEPVSLYVHIPYCKEICWYCGCSTGAANRQQRLTAYLDALDREIDLVVDRLEGRGRVERIAFGGGSPNAISKLQFVRLVDRLITCFNAAEAHISVELDPRLLDVEWACLIGEAGVGSASLGVQSFAPHVQDAIGRIQPRERIAEATEALRAAGVRSINFDLMYGLPHQSAADLAETIDAAVEMMPERLAVFGYAHLPQLIARQRRIDSAALPRSAERFSQAELAWRKLVEAGYEPIGFDHFALPSDPLAAAKRQGRLRRNFQGFTDDQCETVIGLGASAISRFPALLAQNEKSAGRYRMLTSAKLLATRRGVRRTAEDRRRGAAIEAILCSGRTKLSPDLAVGIGTLLAPYLEAGLVRADGPEFVLQPHALPYARAIASSLDAYRCHSVGTFSHAI
jgi:oxygen-independent coproporphyrinogen-3 oxidase